MLHHSQTAKSMFGDGWSQRIVCSNFEALPDNANYIRIDEIKD